MRSTKNNISGACVARGRRCIRRTYVHAAHMYVHADVYRTCDIVFARYNSTSVTVIAVIVASYAGISRQSVSSTTTRPMLVRV